jgi:lipopolysaccharide transport system permease protein
VARSARPLDLRHSPRAVIASLWDNRRLVWQLTKREVVGRYRGSLFGLAWSFFHPLLMLAIYTLVFGFIFHTRWGGAVTSTADFAIVLFAGLIVFNVFSEAVNRAPGLLLAYTSYVKKVVFPLECLPWVPLAGAAFHAAVSLLVLVVANLVLRGALPWTIVLLPLLVVPLLLFSIGCAWLLASLGVYVRDVGQAVGVFTTVLLFLSPVFYPSTALPETLRSVLLLNPLATLIEQSRAVLIWGQPPSWVSLAWCYALSLPVACLGLLWFDRTRAGFADVL